MTSRRPPPPTSTPRANPFVYFHSIIDNTETCDSHVVNLDLLPRDLATATETPNYVFITVRDTRSPGAGRRTLLASTA